MGTIHHNAVIVTGWNEHVDLAREKALDLWAEAFADDEIVTPEGARSLVGEVVDGLTNGYRTFFIAPDGSKEWWSTSDAVNGARNAFLTWLRESELYLDYVMVGYGDLGLQVEDRDGKRLSAK